MTKKVEDLVYPDVVEVSCKEELEYIRKYNPKLDSWNKSDLCYLVGKPGAVSGNGQANIKNYKGKGYNRDNYVIYSFQDILFPETLIEIY